MPEEHSVAWLTYCSDLLNPAPERKQGFLFYILMPKGRLVIDNKPKTTAKYLWEL